MLLALYNPSCFLKSLLSRGQSFGHTACTLSVEVWWIPPSQENPNNLCLCLISFFCFPSLSCHLNIPHQPKPTDLFLQGCCPASHPLICIYKFDDSISGGESSACSCSISYSWWLSSSPLFPDHCHWGNPELLLSKLPVLSTAVSRSLIKIIKSIDPKIV